MLFLVAYTHGDAQSSAQNSIQTFRKSIFKIPFSLLFSLEVKGHLCLIIQGRDGKPDSAHSLQRCSVPWGRGVVPRCSCRDGMVGRALPVVSSCLMYDGRGKGMAFFILFTWNGARMIKMF